jgi:DNA (cytosine-5)-methyltransferase 1
MELREEFGLYLRQARDCYTQAEIAAHMQVDVRQVRRWEIGESAPKPYAVERLKQLPLFSSVGRTGEGDFRFIDLFAGIGGFRAGFESVGGSCVFTSEWDRFCQKTYHENFEVNHPIAGDITKVETAEIPDHDVLVAGFPCQPFSIAGVSKKNSLGRHHGFMCEAQGTLFFDIARIIKDKRPRAFLLENVKNLRSHDRGRTFEVIMGTLRDELGYDVYARVIDAKHLVPQHRERIFIVGFREPVAWDWEALQLPEKGSRTMSSVLHSRDRDEPEHDSPKGYTNGRGVNPKYILSDKLWNYLQQYALNHRAKGNGFGFGLVGPDDTARTLSARYYKDGSEILVRRNARNPRRLTPRECARLMGYPDSFRIPVSDTQAYKQFGNSVVPLLVEEIARVMKPFILDDMVQQSLPVAARTATPGLSTKSVVQT